VATQIVTEETGYIKLKGAFDYTWKKKTNISQEKKNIGVQAY
jgi:hypothetical protein